MGIYAAKPGSTIVLVGLGQRDKMYSMPITHAAVSLYKDTYSHIPRNLKMVPINP